MGDRYAIFTGVDDLVVESAVLGIDGWVAGTGIAFPAQNQWLWELMQAGEWEKALAVYRWFTPLLHLDTHVKFVQYIKLAVQECGLGKEWTRAPRLPLTGAERKAVLKVIHDGIAAAPKVPKRKRLGRGVSWNGVRKCRVARATQRGSISLPRWTASASSTPIRGVSRPAS